MMLTEHHVTERLFAELMALPLWVKLVLFLDLKNDLTQYLSSGTIEHLSGDDPIALFAPCLTEAGEQFLNSNPQDSLLAPVLQDAKMRLSVLDICLRRQINLCDFCDLLLRAIDQGWIHPPASIKITASVEYLSGRTRLGEYLLKIGLIRPDQLDQALRAQKYIDEAMNDHTKLANILINLGYITRKDSETILFLKDESKKPIPKSVFWDLI